MQRRHIRPPRPLAPGDLPLYLTLPTSVSNGLSLAASQSQTGLHLWFVTLCFSDSGLRDWATWQPLIREHGKAALVQTWAWQAADLFAHAIANERRQQLGSVELHSTGALLGVDLGDDNHRPHFHGLVVSQRSQLELDQLWHQLGEHAPIAEHLRRRVQPVTASGEDWSYASPALVAELVKTTRYLAKRLPGGYATSLPLAARLIATGCLAGPAATEASDAEMITAASRLDRRCRACDAPLPLATRKHAQTCSVRCRVALHRRSRVAKRDLAEAAQVAIHEPRAVEPGRVANADRGDRA